MHKKRVLKALRKRVVELESMIQTHINTHSQQNKKNVLPPREDVIIPEWTGRLYATYKGSDVVINNDGELD